MKQNADGSVKTVNAATTPPAHGTVGLYSAAGAMRISFGADNLTGLYAADGSIRVVFITDAQHVAGAGLYAATGRMRCVASSNAPLSYANPGMYGKDGAMKVSS